jgi:hypothetical protein
VVAGTSRSIDRRFGSFCHTSLAFVLYWRSSRPMMIVFDPAIFRLPVLTTTLCTTKLQQQQPEVAIHDGRRGSQWAGLGGWGIRHTRKQPLTCGKRTNCGSRKKRIPRKSRRCTHTEQIRPASSSTRLLPCRTRQGTSNGFVQR